VKSSINRRRPDTCRWSKTGGSFPTVGSNSRSGTCRLLTDDAARERVQCCAIADQRARSPTSGAIQWLPSLRTRLG
jgi:hypothetical protein